MDRQGFVRLSLLALVVVFSSFLVLGFGRIAFGFRTAQVLAAPIGVVGFLLLVYLFLRATLAAVGLWEIEDGDA